jgi:hypothetical protein
VIFSEVANFKKRFVANTEYSSTSAIFRHILNVSPNDEFKKIQVKLTCDYKCAQLPPDNAFVREMFIILLK